MSTPYNPTGSNDNNDEPDRLTDRAESSDSTTNFSRSEATSERGASGVTSSAEWGTGESATSGTDASSTSDENPWGTSSQSDYPQSGYSQSDYGSQSQSYSQFGQPQYGQADYSQGDYSQGDYSQSGYSQTSYGAQSQGQPQYAAQQGQYQQPGQAQGHTQYGHTQYGQPDYSQPQYAAQQDQYQQQGQFGVQPGQFQQPAKGRRGDGDSFFKALFDFSFSRYITIDFVKVIYAIVLAFIALGWVVGLIMSFTGFADGVGTGFLLVFGFLIFGTAAAFLSLVFARIGLEFYVAMVKTAQNTSKLVEYEKDKA